MKAYKLNSWWLTYEKDFKGSYQWKLHGNNDIAIDNNPYFAPGEMIETSRVKTAAIEEDGFIFTTKNARYYCPIADTIEERFNWLLDDKLWEKGLSAEEIEHYIEEMKQVLIKRQEAMNNQPPREFPAEGYLLMALDAERPFYYCDVLYKRDGDFLNLQMKSTMEYEKPHVDLIDDCEEEIDIDNIALCYDIVAPNTIRLYSSLIYWYPVFFVNYGSKDIYIDSFYGRYVAIAHTGKAYRISADSAAGRVAVYPDGDSE